MDILDLHGRLFSPKEMYEISCSRRGKLPLVDGSVHRMRKAQYENLHLRSGMEFSHTYGFPVLKPYNGTVNFTMVPYSDRKKAEGRGQFVGFFSDDYKWGYALWNRLEASIYSLRKFDGIFSPDYSLYADEEFKMFNMTQIYKSRFVGAYAQNIGYNVIPTASMGDVDSIKYCFDGLPEHSIIGICGTGLGRHMQCELWEYGLRALEEMKKPTLIIVYGPERKVIGLNTPLMFIQDQITKYHRNGRSEII